VAEIPPNRERHSTLKAILAGAISPEVEPYMAISPGEPYRVFTLKEYDESNASDFESNLDRRFPP